MDIAARRLLIPALAAVVLGGALVARQTQQPSAVPPGQAGMARADDAATDSGQIHGTGKERRTRLETAIFGAGCFWGVEAAFRQVKGVQDAACGYSGGTVRNPTYEQVCSDATGHAEVVQVRFDPAVVSYGDLLDVFWKMHDPTQVNRQGPDYGSQYRSVVFYTSEAQKKASEQSRAKLEQSGRFRQPIATQIQPAGEFWRAEEYHQRYYEKHGLKGCAVR